MDPFAKLELLREPELPSEDFIRQLNSRLNHPLITKLNSVAYVKGFIKGNNSVTVRMGQALYQVTNSQAIDMLKDKIEAKVRARTRVELGDESEVLDIVESINPESIKPSEKTEIDPKRKFVFNIQDVLGKDFKFNSSDPSSSSSSSNSKVKEISESKIKSQSISASNSKLEEKPKSLLDETKNAVALSNLEKVEIIQETLISNPSKSEDKPKSNSKSKKGILKQPSTEEHLIEKPESSKIVSFDPSVNVNEKKTEEESLPKKPISIFKQMMKERRGEL